MPNKPCESEVFENKTPPKFRRVAPEARRDDLIRAALRCLIKEGHAGLSVRRIAKEAKVSVGLTIHHFDSIENLVAAVYETVADEIIVALCRCMDADGNTPAERLEAFLRGSFSTKVLDRDLLSAWVVFWSMIKYSPRMDEAHSHGYGRYLKVLQTLLEELAQSEGFCLERPRMAAIGLSALLDGLWLEWCLNAQTFSPEDGLDLCRCWVEGLRKGVFGNDQSSTIALAGSNIDPRHATGGDQRCAHQ